MKALPHELFLARFVARVQDPRARVSLAAGRRALRCPGFRSVLDATGGALTVGRFISNVLHSWSLTHRRFSPDPRNWSC